MWREEERETEKVAAGWAGEERRGGEGRAKNAITTFGEELAGKW